MRVSLPAPFFAGLAFILLPFVYMEVYGFHEAAVALMDMGAAMCSTALFMDRKNIFRRDSETY